MENDRVFDNTNEETKKIFNPKTKPGSLILKETQMKNTITENVYLCLQPRHIIKKK